MGKKRLAGKGLLFIVVVLVFTLSGCDLLGDILDGIIDPDNNDTPNTPYVPPVVTPKGKISIIILNKIPSTADIVPGLDLSPSYYMIHGMNSLGYSFDYTVYGTNRTTDSIELGTWVITVSAYNANNYKIGEKSATVSLSEGQTPTATVDVDMDIGTGNLYLSTTWTTGIYPSVAADLSLSTSAGSLVDSYTISSSGGFHNFYCMAGSYTLTLTLRSGSDVIEERTASVIIARNDYSTEYYTWTFTDDLTVTLSTSIPASITASLSVSPAFAENPPLPGTVYNLAHGTDIVVTASSAEPQASYQWCLNGVDFTGETNPSITIGSALDYGYYTLDVLVTDKNGTRFGAQGFSFRISE